MREKIRQWQESTNCTIVKDPNDKEKEHMQNNVYVGITPEQDLIHDIINDKYDVIN